MAKLAGEKGLITAIDVLESALETLRAKAKSEGLNNIALVRANLEVVGATGLSESSQDLVILANVLHESGKKEEILKEARRVLKEGGGMVIISWKKGVNGFGPPDEYRFDEISMTKIVEQIGFKYVNEIDAGTFHFGLVFRKV